LNAIVERPGTCSGPFAFWDVAGRENNKKKDWGKMDEGKMIKEK